MYFNDTTLKMSPKNPLLARITNIMNYYLYTKQYFQLELLNHKDVWVVFVIAVNIVGITKLRIYKLPNEK